ncbi:hypothetical protein [Roseibium algae]|uniref:Uncharacterized protein n=1 Tax=Roseibium algae TaxID=3123038 RepID=A0ABU8TL03_9HYPH
MNAGNQMRSLILLIGLASITMIADQQSGSAQNQVAQQQVGWVNDVRGMRHFSGLRCPDIVGSLFRTKVLAADADRMAGCVYTGDHGFKAILRQHLSGTSQKAAEHFQSAYKSAGFSQISLSGAAESGISFKTRDWTANTLCETLWRFSGRKADYTLWMSYLLPSQEADVGPAVAAFTNILTSQN